MNTLVSVTQKGQITIPKKFREMLNINLYDKVKITLRHDKIEVKPTFDILDIAGSIRKRTNRTKSVLKARQHLEKRYTRT